ncbi:MAG: TonB-dependent receptor [Ignavibacteriaceae bacterium]
MKIFFLESTTMWAVIIFFLGAVLINAQTYEISGVVQDTLGNPVVGANVVINSSSIGTATNFDGKFSIKKLKPGKYSLTISSVGYSSLTVPNLSLRDKSINLNLILHQVAIQSEQVVVTASKYEQKISDLPVSAEIIKSDEFSKKDITDLADALRYALGVNMVDNQISIRGSSGYSRGAGTRVLMEIDGIPYYTGDTGDIVWEAIPVTEIDHVEIIKGAASSLYGSSAIGGVVNVITKNISSQPSTYVKTGFGFYDKPSYSIWDWSKELRTYTGLTLSHSDRIGKFGFSLTLTRLADMSYKQSGFYTRYIGFIKGNYDFSHASSLMFFVNSLNQDDGNFLYWKDSRNALVPPDADQGQSVLSDRYMFGIDYKDVISQNLFINVRGSYYKTKWSDNTSSQNSSKTNFFRGEVQANANINDKTILVSGIEATASNVQSNIFGNPTAYSFGVYSQVDFKFEIPLTISAGVRYDLNKLDAFPEGMDSQNISNAVSPKLGINYKVSERLSLRSSFGTGFRAPSLAEAFTSTSASGITIKPNPSIKPETSWDIELGANYQITNFANIDAAIFQNEFFDFIEPTVDPKDGLIFFSNVTRARIQGAELNLNNSFFDDKLSMSLNYIYLWARDLQLNQALKYRPRNSVTASLDYLMNNFDFGADFRYWSRVEEMDFELVDLGILKDGRNRVAVYVLDLRASSSLNLFGIPAKISLNANNILNYNYVELIGNLAPIRNYSIGLEFFF